MGNAIGSPTVKCFRFVCKNLTTFFGLANASLESSIRGLFGEIFGFSINVVVYEKLAKNNDSSTKTRMQAAHCCCPCCDNSRCRCRRRRAACTFMNARYGAALHSPRLGQPVATRPVPKLDWADLFSLYYLHARLLREFFYKVSVSVFDSIRFFLIYRCIINLLRLS